ncbi:hypothetical protein BSK66_01625 [Paenibacillus odorifer]|jgi:hypothetical protein|uniref:DUF4446 domain-containing protein n=1 Tax=Paenibacillus odorifer TaxID=189426 RepID=A0A1R0X8M0_9BACL|nr:MULTISPECIES: DUF4446 family protein [Paenibacillus]AWV36497.1 hypothetical protein CD191_29965 [Paenibacillus odorifer]ETT66520.1 hypothetical protein C171_05175 [Paenibacillus sp. FSL H8-237]MDH6429096.1 hypothetical protein [Paenibacillus sp. PastH-4]MDH6445301.1 hypothetical protein [Paenibacillus sp. PastF-4]MDH6529191.1 hypothetical protein [Paenibacillus sp. PastH-3]
MSEMNQLINEQLQWFVFGFVVIMLVLIVTVIAQGAKLRTIRRKYEAMMAGSGVEDLEGLLVDLKNQSDMLEEEQREQKALIEATQVKIRGMKSNIALKRYNAFGERGNDLSFSVAILDDNSSGIVLTSLHNRENSYIYSKPMQNGESQYALSPEEKEVITLALQQK